MGNEVITLSQCWAISSYKSWRTSQWDQHPVTSVTMCPPSCHHLNRSTASLSLEKQTDRQTRCHWHSSLFVLFYSLLDHSDSNKLRRQYLRTVTKTMSGTYLQPSPWERATLWQVSAASARHRMSSFTSMVKSLEVNIVTQTLTLLCAVSQCRKGKGDSHIFMIRILFRLFASSQK